MVATCTPNPYRIILNALRVIAHEAQATIDCIGFRHVFGIDPSVKNGIQVVDESTVLYVAAHCIVLHSTATRTQRFLHLGSDSRGAVCLATTPNRRWLAVSERGASKGYVTIYDMAILKKRKVLIPSQDNAAAKVQGHTCALALRIALRIMPQIKSYDSLGNRKRLPN